MEEGRKKMKDLSLAGLKGARTALRLLEETGVSPNPLGYQSLWSRAGGRDVSI